MRRWEAGVEGGEGRGEEGLSTRLLRLEYGTAGEPEALRGMNSTVCTTYAQTPPVSVQPPTAIHYEQEAGGWISDHNMALSGVDFTLILNPCFLKDGVGRVEYAVFYCRIKSN